MGITSRNQRHISRIEQLRSLHRGSTDRPAGDTAIAEAPPSRKGRKAAAAGDDD